MLAALDEAPLTRRYYMLVAVVMVGAVLDFFDLFLIAFIVPVVSDEWDLTFGEASVVLLSAGVGAILGSILWGRAGDRYGRKKPLIVGIVTFSLATGGLTLAPEGGWWYMGLLRLVVGAGGAGVAVMAVPLMLEFTPTRLRTKLTGFVTTAMVPVGILVAAGSAALLIDPLGWRPLFAIGVLPIGLAFLVMRIAPESPRWLIDQGRPDEARQVIAWLIRRDERDLAIEAPSATEHEQSYGALMRYRSSVVLTVVSWLGASVAVAGLVLWGPTFLEQILDIDPDNAAALFILVTLGSFTGRLFFSFAPDRIGRRRAGMIMGFGAAPLLALAGVSGDTEVGGVPVFLLALVAAAFFVDGGFANLTPYTPEIYPTSLRTHGMGLAWAVSGLGRIVGPLLIGVIAGSGDVVDPAATAGAQLPAFLILAGFALTVGLAFLVIRLETHGTDLETLSARFVEETDRPPDAPRAAAQPG